MSVLTARISNNCLSNAMITAVVEPAVAEPT